jgi:phage terminase small subunit
MGRPKKKLRTPIVSERDREFARQYLLEKKSGRQAALDAGFPESRARNVGTSIIAKRGVQIALKDIQKSLRKRGVSSDYYASKIQEGLEAEKQDQYTGSWTPDFNSRHKYLETALKLERVIEKEEVNPGAGNISQIFLAKKIVITSKKDNDENK